MLHCNVYIIEKIIKRIKICKLVNECLHGSKVIIFEYKLQFETFSKFCSSFQALKDKMSKQILINLIKKTTNIKV